MGALDGIRILDFTRLLPGGFCSWLLADLGAEVIKVEEPGRGDYLRSFPPLKVRESGMFLALNRNKKSLTVNLKATEGKDILRWLVSVSDVLLEGNRPGVMHRLGLDYETLRRSTPVSCIARSPATARRGRTGTWSATMSTILESPGRSN